MKKKNMLMKITAFAMVVSAVVMGGPGSFIGGIGEPTLPKRLDK